MAHSVSIESNRWVKVSVRMREDLPKWVQKSEMLSRAQHDMEGESGI